MADRDHEDHRSFGEKLFGRHEHDREEAARGRGTEDRSWRDDQGSGYDRGLYRSDNEHRGEPRSEDQARLRQGGPTYGDRDASPGARRSDFREDQRHAGIGWTGDRGASRNADDYGMGRRDFSRFERGDGERGGGRGQGGGSGSFGTGGYGQSGGRGGGPNQGAHQFYGEPNPEDRGAGKARDHDHDHDLEPHYRDWRERQLADYDRHYSDWRDTQARKHDDEYRSWRDQRRGEFHNEFETWRSSRSGSQGGGAPSQGAHGEGDLTGHGQGQGLSAGARSGAESREASWSSGAGAGTGQGTNSGGGSLAQGVPNGGIAPGGGHYGEEYPTSGVTTAGGFNADTAGSRPTDTPLHSTGGQSQSQSQGSAGGTNAPVGANAALHNVAEGGDASDDKDQDKGDRDRAN